MVADETAARVSGPVMRWIYEDETSRSSQWLWDPASNRRGKVTREKRGRPHLAGSVLECVCAGCAVPESAFAAVLS